MSLLTACSGGSPDGISWERIVQTPVDRSKKSFLKRLRTKAEHGIPDELRKDVYPWLLKKDGSVDVYERLRSRKVTDEELAHTIAADALRTLPRNTETLERILTAYALSMPELGYTQGMSQIAAVLINHTNSESEAFESFTGLMTLLNYTNVFKPGFQLLFRWMRMFECLMEIEIPGLHKRLMEKGITSEMYLDKWFLTAMTYNFPNPTCLRIWDIMLIDGNEKIMFRSAIVILKLGEEKGIYRRGFEEAVGWLQRGFAEEKELLEEACDVFMRRASSVQYKRSTLEKAAMANSMPNPENGRRGRRWR